MKVSMSFSPVEPLHLFRYLDEQGFRCNNREMTYADRLDIAVRNIAGKRITYEQLTGKQQEKSSALFS